MQTGGAIFLSLLVIVTIIACAGFFLSQNLILEEDAKQAQLAAEKAIADRELIADNYQAAASERDLYDQQLVEMKNQVTQIQQSLAEEQVKNGALIAEVTRLNELLLQRQQTIDAHQSEKAAILDELERQKATINKVTIERTIALQQWEKRWIEAEILKQELADIRANQAFFERVVTDLANTKADPVEGLIAGGLLATTLIFGYVRRGTWKSADEPILAEQAGQRN